jgi:hypothetical protein
LINPERQMNKGSRPCSRQRLHRPRSYCDAATKTPPEGGVLASISRVLAVARASGSRTPDAKRCMHGFAGFAYFTSSISLGRHVFVKNVSSGL